VIAFPYKGFVLKFDGPDEPTTFLSRSWNRTTATSGQAYLRTSSRDCPAEPSVGIPGILFPGAFGRGSKACGFKDGDRSNLCRAEAYSA
jgi:hypothetical protein